MLHAYPCVAAVEVVSAIYITLYIPVFVDKLKEIPFFMSIYNSFSFWFFVR